MRLNPIIPILGLGLLLLVAPATLPASDKIPGPKDRCAVCGMFVSRTPSWLASISLRGGKVEFFDGPKDLFRFRFGLAKYAKGITPADIEGMSVTEYYSAKPMRAQDALYAVGSDVLGPMGAELVPIQGKARADAFTKDHKAKKIVSFSEITPELLATLE
jgi:copper chaperone NosL